MPKISLLLTFRALSVRPRVTVCRTSITLMRGEKELLKNKMGEVLSGLSVGSPVEPEHESAGQKLGKVFNLLSISVVLAHGDEILENNV